MSRRSRYDGMCTMSSWATTASSYNDEHETSFVQKSFASQPNLHDGAWFVAQGRKYADEANAMVARWGRLVIAVIVAVAALERFT